MDVVIVVRNIQSLLKILRYYTDPYETGIVVEIQPEVHLSSFKPLAIFFSRVHFDIFGLFFPVDMPDVDAAISYVAQVYQSVEVLANLAITVNTGTNKVEYLRGTNSSRSTSKQRWPELFKTDTETLQR